MAGESSDFDGLISEMDSFLANAEDVCADDETKEVDHALSTETLKAAPKPTLTPKKSLSARRYNEIVQEALSEPHRKRSASRRAYKRSKSESLSQQQIISAVRASISLDHQKLYDMFASLDQRKRGRITRKELADGIASVANGLSEFEIKRFVRWVDTDHDGLISFQEFWQVFETEYTDKSKQTWYPKSPQSSPNSQLSMPTMDVFTQYQMTSPLQSTERYNTRSLSDSSIYIRYSSTCETEEETKTIDSTTVPELPKLRLVDSFDEPRGLDSVNGNIQGKDSHQQLDMSPTEHSTFAARVNIHGARNLFAYTDTGGQRIVNVRGICYLENQKFELPLVFDSSTPRWDVEHTFTPFAGTKELSICLLSDDGYKLGWVSINLLAGQGWRKEAFKLSQNRIQDSMDVAEVEVSVEYIPVEDSRSTVEREAKGDDENSVEAPWPSSVSHAYVQKDEDVLTTITAEEAKAYVPIEKVSDGVSGIAESDGSATRSLVVESKTSEQASTKSHDVSVCLKADQLEVEVEPKKEPGPTVPQSTDDPGSPSLLASFLDPSSDVASESWSGECPEAGTAKELELVERLSNEEFAEMLTLVENSKERENEAVAKLSELQGAVHALQQQISYHRQAKVQINREFDRSQQVALLCEERYLMAREETIQWQNCYHSCEKTLQQIVSRLESLSSADIPGLKLQSNHADSKHADYCWTLLKSIEAEWGHLQLDRAVLQRMKQDLATEKALCENERVLNHKHHETQNVLKDQLQEALDDKRACVSSLQAELETEREQHKLRESALEEKIRSTELREHEFLSKEESLSRCVSNKEDEIETLKTQNRQLRYRLMAESQQQELVSQLTKTESALTEEVTVLQRHCSELQEENQKLNVTNSQMRDTIQRSDSNCRELISSLDAVNLEKKLLLQNLGQHVERIRILEANSSAERLQIEVEELEEQRERLTSDLLTLEESHNQQGEVETLKASLDAALAENRSLANQLAVSTAALKDLKLSAGSNPGIVDSEEDRQLRQRMENHENQILSLFQKNQALASINSTLTAKEEALERRVAQLDAQLQEEKLKVPLPQKHLLSHARTSLFQLKKGVDKPAIKLLLADYAKAQDHTFNLLLSLFERHRVKPHTLASSTARSVSCTVVCSNDSKEPSNFEIKKDTHEILIRGKTSIRWFQFDRVFSTGASGISPDWVAGQFDPAQFLNGFSEGRFLGTLVCMGPAAGETTTETISSLFNILAKDGGTYDVMLGCVELTESQEVFDLLKGPEVLKRLGEQTNQVKTRDVDNPALEDLDITIVKVSSKREASLVAAMAASNRITASAERRLSHPKSCVEPNSHMVLQVEVCRGSNVKETSKFCIIELASESLKQHKASNSFLMDCAEDLASLFNCQHTSLSCSLSSSKIGSLVRECCHGQAQLCAHVSFHADVDRGQADLLLALGFARGVRSRSAGGPREMGRPNANVTKAILDHSDLDLGALHTLFLKWDRNQKGSLSRQEFVRGMKSIDPSLSNEDMDDFFAASARDGELRFHDFYKLLGESRKPRKQPALERSHRKKRSRLYQALSPEHARLVQPLQALKHERRRASFNAYRVTNFQATLRKYS